MGRTAWWVAAQAAQFSGRDYSMMFLSNSARPNLTLDGVATAPADQLRDVWGPLTANAGTFQVSGSTVTIRPMVAKMPFVMFNQNIQLMQGIVY